MTRKLGTAINNNFDNTEMSINSRLAFGNNGDSDFYSGDLNKLVDLINPEIQLEGTDQVTGLDTALAGKQPLDATLTALAGLDTSVGAVVQTGVDTFVKRTFEDSDNIVWTESDGVAGNFSAEVANSGVTPGTVGSASKSAIITTGLDGRVTAQSETNIAISKTQITDPAALTKVDDANVTLTLGGSPNTALLNATSITAGWAGQLAVARGGTGLASTTAYGLLAGGTTTTGNFQNIGTGATGTILQGNGSSALPTFSNATYPSSTTANRILYSSSNDVVDQIATAANGVLVTNGSSVPSISSTLPSAVWSRPSRTITADTTLTTSDNGGIIYCNSVTPITVTLPRQSTAALTSGFNCKIININLGDVRLTKENLDIFYVGNSIIGQYDQVEVFLQNASTVSTWVATGGTEIRLVSYAWDIETGSNASFIYLGIMPANTTLMQAYFKTNSGTITGQLTLNGVSITGSMSMSTTQNYAALTSPNLAQIGNILGLTLSSNSSGAQIHVGVYGYTRVYAS
jgi:hypothetical protein